MEVHHNLMRTTQTIYNLSITIFLFLLLTANCFASSELNLTPQAKESVQSYTLGDLAVSRLAVYGIFGEDMRTPTEAAQSPFSRIEAVMLLKKAFGKSGDAACEIPFEDVEPDDTDAVAWAYANGIASGVSETEFGTADITEREFATMLLNTLGYRGCFAYADALTFSRRIGLTAFGKSDGFLLSDAALYLQDAMGLSAPNGTRIRDKMNIADHFTETTFPNSIRLTPRNAGEAEEQIRAALRYLPFEIDVITEHLSQEDAYSVYYGYLRDSFDLEKSTYTQEKWYAPYLDIYSSIAPSVKFYSGAAEPRIALYLSFNNAWKLTCELDDAFAYYDSAALSRQADSFYQKYVAGAQSDKDAILKAKAAIVDNACYARASEIVNGEKIYPSESHTLLGFFQNSEIVCDGYAELFQYLMIRAGIPCVTVLGSSRNAQKAYENESDHAWNKVKLDGKWYNMDVCWADTGNTTMYDLKDNAFYLQHEHWAVTHRGL